MIRNVESLVRAPVCETRKGEGLEPVQIPGRVVQEALVPVLEGHSHTDREVQEALVAVLVKRSRTDREVREALAVLEGYSRSDREALEASVAGRMDSMGSMVADMALAWEALAVASASVCVHEHRAHPEQN